MIGALKKLLSGGDAQGDALGGFDELTVAAAALMIEAAMVDDRFAGEEREKILALVREKLIPDPELAERLVRHAEAEVTGSVQLFSFTSAVKNGYSYDERVALMQSLWEVVLADGHVDPHEDQLLRRLGSLIYVTDRDRNIARKKALEHKRGHTG